jgi:hypothetical protein
MDKDSDFLFEAYNKIYEAPVGPGSAWDDEVSIDPSQSERLGKSQYGQIGEEDVYRVVQNIKEFLADHEGSIYPGSMEDLKLEIKVIIQDTVEGVNATKAGYAARVLRNELKRLNVIDDSVDGTNVEVQDVAKVDSLTDELDDALDVNEQPGEFKLNLDYDVDREISATASPEAKEIHNTLLDAGLAFGAHNGKALVKASGVPYSIAKVIFPELEAIGAISRIEKEEDNDDKVVDVGDEDDDDYDDVVSKEYERLRRDISSGEAPVMRPDDFDF